MFNLIFAAVIVIVFIILILTLFFPFSFKLFPPCHHLSDGYDYYYVDRERDACVSGYVKDGMFVPMRMMMQSIDYYFKDADTLVDLKLSKTPYAVRMDSHYFKISSVYGHPSTPLM
jgi:hypothetical protein